MLKENEGEDECTELRHAKRKSGCFKGCEGHERQRGMKAVINSEGLKIQSEKGH